ncbi:hypothetical protein MKY14_06605 [Paenibacillus sp. FSL R5-0887]|uniref:hypothetical protein n=1 Tax=unclassified Paenibacillus TaxID=185978 RepID=UPI0030D4D67A
MKKVTVAEAYDEGLDYRHISKKKTKRINAPFRSLPMSPLAVSACCPGINIPETSVA